jgi:hypothetical protein
MKQKWPHGLIRRPDFVTAPGGIFRLSLTVQTLFDLVGNFAFGLHNLGFSGSFDP